MSNKIYIDNSRFMELIDAIATQITEAAYGEDTYGLSSEVGQEDVVMFQEDAYYFYNQRYNKTKWLLNNIANI